MVLARVDLLVQERSCREVVAHLVACLRRAYLVVDLALQVFVGVEVLP